MSISASVRWDQKLGNDKAEFEDAFHLAPMPAADGWRFAVADGATESSYSRHWAQLLVRAFGDGASTEHKLSRRLASLQSTWTQAHQAEGLPWFAAEKIAMGAFAAMVGVRIIEVADETHMHSLAAGDCTLVLVRGGRVELAWPVETSRDFGLNPLLLSSIGEIAGAKEILSRRQRVSLRPQDRVLLLSDAIGAWLLAGAEAGRAPWDELAEASHRQEDFRDWSRHLRTAGQMRNDDVTALTIEVAQATR